MTMLRIITDAETLLAGFAYPSSAQGRIVAAWRHKALEIALTPRAMARLAEGMTRLGRAAGWPPLQVCAMVNAVALQVIRLGSDEVIGPAPSGEGKAVHRELPRGAACVVTHDETVLAQDLGVRIVTPGDFWAAYG
ncbi:hypothetical protein WV31_08385 [Magnetospirillum sp. ME-1]|uniref:hypothetical protein n=1 Tax=Magnetospirillum sp. ME-1 TaxID=1639348 RepID=UPI000A17BD3A|nr:hypothetical protein [Magnetospirillum sp. ME-1]ARJ65671.1 hypothetical protein WV31_08385 [Magnetospirillum sp. ME-1]